MVKKLKDYDFNKFTNFELNLIKYLHVNTSQRNPKTSSQISERFGIKGNELRQLIHDLRMKEVQICSDNTGYYIPYNDKPIKYTIKHLKSRARKMMEVAEALEESLVE